MITLGIDPGSLVTGYGVVQSEGKRLAGLDFGVIRTDARSPMPVRLKTIYDGLERLIETYEPERLSIETVFFGKNVQASLKLGQVRGAVMILAMNHGMEVAEYAPREVKKAVSGGGGAAKEQVAFMVQKILNLTDTGKFLDATDALALAICDANRSASPLASHAKDWKSFIMENPHLVVR
ncbi:MAG: crossover junction endodeoxyribonuclease RuvC [Rhizobacter sp.]|nr:crossover junction endodeoxyribonuclease RuvC [Chlorobiales bacterium]